MSIVHWGQKAWWRGSPRSSKARPAFKEEQMHAEKDVLAMVIVYVLETLIW